MSASRFALDTNILVYAIDGRQAAKRGAALAVIDASRRLDAWLSTQALGEFYVAATRKLRMPAAAAAVQVRQWMALFSIAEPSAVAVRAALAAAESGRFGYYDALMLATAAEAGCRVLLSEDMADGAILGDIVVRHPFGSGPDGLSVAARAVLGMAASSP